jgi:hypothetical protein
MTDYRDDEVEALRRRVEQLTETLSALIRFFVMREEEERQPMPRGVQHVFYNSLGEHWRQYGKQ